MLTHTFTDLKVDMSDMDFFTNIHNPDTTQILIYDTDIIQYMPSWN